MGQCHESVLRIKRVLLLFQLNISYTVYCVVCSVYTGEKIYNAIFYTVCCISITKLENAERRTMGTEKYLYSRYAPKDQNTSKKIITFPLKIEYCTLPYTHTFSW